MIIIEHPFLLYLSIASIALAVTLGLTPLVHKVAVKFDIVDKPGTRKIHLNPIPRMGGLAIVGGTVAALGIFGLYNPRAFYTLFVSKGYFYILLGSLAMMALGLFDDKYGLNAKIKFAIQFAVAIFVVAMQLKITRITNPFGEPFNLGLLAYPVTVLWIVGVTNAINLADGLDGLAAGISLIVAVTMFAISLTLGHPAIVIMSAALTGALLAFLKYNFNPAKIFMGTRAASFWAFCSPRCPSRARSSVQPRPHSSFPWWHSGCPSSTRCSPSSGASSRAATLSPRIRSMCTTACCPPASTSGRPSSCSTSSASSSAPSLFCSQRHRTKSRPACFSFSASSFIRASGGSGTSRPYSST
ncbi:MAG: MraY family glycosyltransferase [Fibrobacterota bacterium]